MNPLPCEGGIITGVTVGTGVNRVTVVAGTVVTAVVTGFVGITDEPGESRWETVVITPFLTSKFASASL